MALPPACPAHHDIGAEVFEPRGVLQGSSARFCSSPQAATLWVLTFGLNSHEQQLTSTTAAAPALQQQEALAMRGLLAYTAVFL